MKQRIINFIDNKKDYPLFAGLVLGLTPLLFYYSNNYWAVNSFSHVLYFLTTVLGSTVLFFLLTSYLLKLNPRLKPFIKYTLFGLVLAAVIFFLTHTFFITFKRRVALVVLLIILAVVLPFEPRKHYKKILVLLSIFSLISLFKVLILIYEDIKPDSWMQQPDDITQVEFKSFPNIYMIQPDGYVSESMLGKPPYNSSSDLYAWLKDNGFKVYDNFRSNYPSSLTSNASLFSMKHHNFGDMLFPEIEMANAREVISVKNPVAEIFNYNGYDTYFIAQDEYFQQNKKQASFTHFNIGKDDFPYYTKGDSEIRDVFKDLQFAMSLKSDSPKFFFVEKLLPHHVAFGGTDDSVVKERENYLERIGKVNNWLKETVNYITAKDKNSIIIILADHGGWAGLKSFTDLFSNTNPDLIKSIFSSLSAIKWNGYLNSDFDKNLKTNVNMFRVLFSVLSEDKTYLKYIEDDASYNLKINSLGFKDVVKLIDEKGNIIDANH